MRTWTAHYQRWWLLVLIGVLFLGYDAYDQYRFRRALCQGSIDGRVSQLVSSEILVLVASADEPRDAQSRDAVQVYRRLNDQQWLSQLPATCRGVMGLEVFRGQVRAQVKSETATLREQLSGRRG